MSPPLRFHPLADDDLIEAWSWYEAQQRGLGDRFVNAVDAALDKVVQWPTSGTPVNEGPGRPVVERRVGTSGFPYLIRYRMIDEAIVVMAVYHQRRRPALRPLAFANAVDGGSRRLTMDEAAFSMQAMSNVLIRDLPEEVHGELRRRAETHGQSLHAFLSAQLTRLVERPPADELLDRVARQATDRVGFDQAVAGLHESRSER